MNPTSPARWRKSAHQVDDADLYFQYTRAEGWSLEEGIVKTGSFPSTRAWAYAPSAAKTAFAYSDDISRPRCSMLPAPCGQFRLQPKGGRAQVASKIAKSRSLYPGLDPIASMDSTAKVQLLERAEQRAAPRIRAWCRSWRAWPAKYDVVLVARADGTLAPTCARWCACRHRDRRAGAAARGGLGRRRWRRFRLAYFSDARSANMWMRPSTPPW